MAGIKQYGGGTGRRWEVVGLDAMLEKLQGEPMYARPWRRAMLEALKYGKATAQSRAPSGATGKLVSKMRYRYQRVPVPLWGVVSNSASNKGFRYGYALDAGHAKRGKSGRSYEFHELGSGSSTRGWFTGVLPVIQGRVNALLEAAAKDIEANW